MAYEGRTSILRADEWDRMGRPPLTPPQTRVRGNGSEAPRDPGRARAGVRGHLHPVGSGASGGPVRRGPGGWGSGPRRRARRPEHALRADRVGPRGERAVLPAPAPGLLGDLPSSSRSKARARRRHGGRKRSSLLVLGSRPQPAPGRGPGDGGGFSRHFNQVEEFFLRLEGRVRRAAAADPPRRAPRDPRSRLQRPAPPGDRAAPAPGSRPVPGADPPLRSRRDPEAGLLRPVRPRRPSSTCTCFAWT